MQFAGGTMLAPCSARILLGWLCTGALLAPACGRDSSAAKPASDGSVAADANRGRPAALDGGSADPGVAGAAATDAASSRGEQDAASGGPSDSGCVPGQQDHDGDGACAQACGVGGPRCGAHGDCVDNTGAARCVCDSEYAGSLCEQCAAEHQDHDGDGQCTIACALFAADCGARSHCDDRDGTAACRCDAGFGGDDCLGCATGFRDDAMGGCEFTGTVVSPGFTDATPWTATGSASVAGGVAQLPADSICFGDVIYQDVAVPGYEDVGPLVLEFQTRRGATQESWPRPGSFVGSALREAKIDSSTSWHDNRVCLGEDAYGGDTRIGFTQYELPRDCSYDPIHVDNAQLRTAAAGECPTPETPIRNGSFDDGDSAWRVDCDPNITCSPVQRGELVLDDPLCAVDVYGEVWLPSEATRPAAAIELSHRGGAGNQLSLTLNGWPVAGFHGDEQEHTSHVCLPVWARGTSVELGFHTDRGGWFCSSAEYVDYVIDDVALVDEPGCPAAAQPLDGDFEGFGGALAFPWVIENDANGQMRAPAVAVVHDAGAALAGDSSLRLEVSYGCQTARVVQGVRVPQLVDDGGGAAVRYGYRHPPPADGAPKASLCVGQQCDELAPAAEWTEQTLCIDPKLQGRVLDLLLRLDGGTGSCTVPLSQPIEVWFDEVTVTTDRDCPAQ